MDKKIKVVFKVFYGVNVMVSQPKIMENDTMEEKGRFSNISGNSI
jgi:hypothetical protein